MSKSYGTTKHNVKKKILKYGIDLAMSTQRFH